MKKQQKVPKTGSEFINFHIWILFGKGPGDLDSLDSCDGWDGGIVGINK